MNVEPPISEWSEQHGGALPLAYTAQLLIPSNEHKRYDLHDESETSDCDEPA
ncbi:hypothetical protein [Paenibacillus campi]|uniref:hypothetical protein n=1 Tax=Paenibacillus campi TaxID=3106031 RepID=UPI002AFEF8F9|nr:hypothetical protein [Paenibacillus sp. SGZ-1014]